MLAGREHEGPLLVQRTLHPEGPVCHAIVVHPPGGIVAGDELCLRVSVGQGGHALLTTPAAGKVYRSTGAKARIRQEFLVEGGALEWLPQENIFYPGACFSGQGTVQSSADARFIGWEVNCLGLPASGLEFRTGAVHQRLDVWRDSRLVLVERQRFDPECAGARWGLASRAAAGTMVAFPATSRELAGARAAEACGTDMGCTLIDDVLVCRAIAARGDRLRAAFVEIWKAIRSGVVGREAVVPRIWAT